MTIQAVELPPILTATRGSDMRFSFVWLNKPVPPATIGEPADLTGRQAVVLDQDAGLAGRVTASITNPAGGVFEVFIEGTNPIPIGLHQFRLQFLVAGGDSVGLLPIIVKVI